jgi:hypothetical protein
MSRAGDPQYHTHVLVQNAAQGPDGRWTALDSDRLYAHLMAADHLYLAAERAALTQRLGVRWGPVDERSGAAEIQGLDDRTLIERFSKRSEQIDQWLDPTPPWPVRDQGVQRPRWPPASRRTIASPRTASMPDGGLSWRSRGWASASWQGFARVDGAVQ